MSLFNTMRTSVSGMAAQSTALSTIGDNIANANTVGYKDASSQFETIIGDQSATSYESGTVQTDIRYGVTSRGTLETTTSPTDLAINGNGFFVVSKGGANNSYLTRAGSFVGTTSGTYVNSAGYELMGYQITDGATSSTLSPVNIPASLAAAASTSGTLTANLPSTATAAASGSTVGTSTNYTQETSLTVYDSLGDPNVVNIYMTKTGDNTWDVKAYQQGDAATDPTTSIGTTVLTFDSSTGAVSTGGTLSLSVNGQTVPIDLSGTTQLASNFSVTSATTNGAAPSKMSSVSVGSDGTMTAVYADGRQLAAFRIPIATVASPDSLTNVSGNAYQVNATSGDMVLTTAGTDGAGEIVADSLEESTVDLATELTNMIQAQRSYEANSKVMQAASDLLSTLNRLTTN